MSTNKRPGKAVLRRRPVHVVLLAAAAVGLWKLGDALQPSAFGYDLTTAGQLLTAATAMWAVVSAFRHWDKVTEQEMARQAELNREWLRSPEAKQRARDAWTEHWSKR